MKTKLNIERTKEGSLVTRPFIGFLSKKEKNHFATINWMLFISESKLGSTVVSGIKMLFQKCSLPLNSVLKLKNEA